MRGSTTGRPRHRAIPTSTRAATARASDRVAYAHDYTDDGSAEDCGGHGTNVASIAAGYNDEPGPSNATTTDSDYNYGLGVAPQVQVGSSKIFACNGAFAHGFSPTAVADAAYAAGARISNNSWANATTWRLQRRLSGVRRPGPGRPAAVRTMTAIRRWSRCSPQATRATASPETGNEGYGTVNSPGTAKNVITVGASENVRTGRAEDGCIVGDERRQQRTRHPRLLEPRTHRRHAPEA